MIAEVDENKNGEIDFVEFLTIMAQNMQDVDTEIGTLEAFKAFDKERTGYIPKDQLVEVLMQMGVGMGKTECEQIIQTLTFTDQAIQIHHDNEPTT